MQPDAFGERDEVLRGAVRTAERHPGRGGPGQFVPRNDPDVAFQLILREGTAHLETPAEFLDGELGARPGVLERRDDRRGIEGDRVEDPVPTRLAGVKGGGDRTVRADDVPAAQAERPQHRYGAEQRPAGGDDDPVTGTNGPLHGVDDALGKRPAMVDGRPVDIERHEMATGRRTEIARPQPWNGSRDDCVRHGFSYLGSAPLAGRCPRPAALPPVAEAPFDVWSVQR